MSPQAPIEQPGTGRQTGSWAEILIGHQRGVRSVAVLPDGRRVLSGSEDETLRLWDLATATELRRFGSNLGMVLSIAPLPNGDQALSGSFDGVIRLWDVESGVELRRFEGHTKWVEAVVVFAEGRRAVSGSGDRTLRLWDLESSTELCRFDGHGGTVSAVAVLPDERRALSGSHDGSVRIWDLSTGVEIRRLEGHQAGVNAIALLPDGTRVLSGSADRTLRLWDLQRGVEPRIFIGHTSPIRSVAVLDQQRVLSGSEDGSLRLWNLETGAGIGRIEARTGGIDALAVLPDRRRVLCGLSDSSLRLWDYDNGKQLVRYFVSFSRTDNRLKEDILKRLRTRFGAARNYRFVGWEDSDIEIGSNWHNEIQKAIAGCDFGLLLISPGFLANPYIVEHELPKFQRVVPVALQTIALDGSIDLRGLEQKQIFFDKNRRAYRQLKGGGRDDFADQLFAKIIKMLDETR